MGRSYRQVSDGVRDLLDELLRDHDGRRVLLVGHAATRVALDHLLTGRQLEDLVQEPFAWQEGWEYVLSAETFAAHLTGRQHCESPLPN